MCGIFGYIGKNNDVMLGLEGLKRLEYRGYDSAGIAAFDAQKNEIVLAKAVGKVANLHAKIASAKIEGSPMIAHCLHPDTLIQLADGSIKVISELSNQEGVVSFNAQQFALEEKNGKIFKHKSSEFLYRIETPVGFIECSPQHELVLYKEGEFIKKKAEDIVEGDILAFGKKISVQGRSMAFQDVFVKRYYQIPQKLHQNIMWQFRPLVSARKSFALQSGIADGYLDHIIANDRNIREDVLEKFCGALGTAIESNSFIPVDTIHGKHIQLPKQSSLELMQVLGYLLGDGTVQKRTVRFKDPDYGVVKKYQTLIKRVFNLESRIVWLPKWNVYLLEVNSQYLCDWLRRNITERKNEFLSQIGALPSAEIAAFIKGIFDAEGGASLQSGQIYIGMTDKRLIRILQMLLQRFGIVASYREEDQKQKNWKTAHKLALSNYENIKQFVNFVSFTSKRKESLVLSLLASMIPGVNVSSKIMPITKQELWSTFFSNSALDVSELKKIVNPTSGKFLSQKQICALRDLLEKKYYPHPYYRVNAKRVLAVFVQFLNGPLVYQRVKKKVRTKSSVSYLYDIEVYGNHNFIANGFLSHNSRWATHGVPSEQNAHPHHDCKKNIYLVHNGIIENYRSLKESLQKEGHKFISQTDTEVVAHLIEKFFHGSTHSMNSGQARASTELSRMSSPQGGNLEEAVRQALLLVAGTFAFGIIAKDDPGKIVLARRSSPLLVGVGEGEFFAASDPAAIVGHTNKVMFLEDNDIAVLTKNGVKISHLFDNHSIDRQYVNLDWDWEEASKSGYPHYMLKEIFEIPEVIVNTLRGRLLPEEGNVKLGGLQMVKEKLRDIQKFILCACGTAGYAGLAGEYMLEEYAQIPVEVEYGSEFRYRKPILDPTTAFIAISQSGETADTLASLREAKEKGILALGIVNAVGSTIARETEAGVYNHAGPEIAVASTKALISQLVVLALITVMLGRQRELSKVTGERIVKELAMLPEKAKTILALNEDIRRLAQKYYHFRNFFYLGRKYNFSSALEGALKLKEVSYIHAEGYCAGEMKHGPIALIDENFPTFAIALSDSVYEKMISNIQEIKARGGKVITIATEGNEEIKQIVDDVIYVPKTLEMLSPILSVIPMQLFAYHMGVLRGCDVDKPRNLAKSVTVE